MEIQTVKDQGESVLINDTLSAPKNESNRHYQAVLEWVAAGGVIEPQFTTDELKANAHQERRALKASLNSEVTIEHLGKTWVFSEIHGLRFAAQVASGVDFNWGADGEDTYTLLTIAQAQEIQALGAARLYAIDSANKADKQAIEAEDYSLSNLNGLV